MAAAEGIELLTFELLTFDSVTLETNLIHHFRLIWVHCVITLEWLFFSFNVI